jgi:translation initiation factor 1
MGKNKPPGNPWTVLEPLRAQLPDKPVPPPVVPAKPEPKAPARAVVRLEKKGRGGKEATVIEKLELAAAELEVWCKDLKAAMGCGGVVVGDTIVLQGDLRKRLPPWLTGRGVKKVTVAN